MSQTSVAKSPLRIGAYDVEGEIGRGGMGVVFRGRDSRLGRAVAIKALTAEVAADPERLARFEREARLLASLNHPNVATVFGLEDVDGTRYLVMEFVEGQTLQQMLANGPLPVEEALPIAAQVAAALEAAHEAGVIHRDLKPGNIMVGSNGRVKVLDFGLAKESGPARGSSSALLSQSPTVSFASGGPATAAGRILGTPGYLSPEQARGKHLDKRTDIWSFGCVLYECLVGRPSFGGETITDAIAATLEREPRWEALPGKTPVAVRDLIGSCLEKDPSRRLRDAGDARIELERAIAQRSWSTSNLEAVRGGPAPARRKSWAALGLGLLAGAAAGYAAAILFVTPREAVPREATRLAMPLPAGVRSLAHWISDDGRTILFMGNDRQARQEADLRLPRLYIRPLDEPEARVLPGTEDARGVAVSPDGRWVACIVPQGVGSSRFQIKKIAADGMTPPVLLCDVPRGVSPQGVIWIDAGRLAVGLAAEGAPVLWYVSNDGQDTGKRVKIKVPPDTFPMSAFNVLPGGEWGLAAFGQYKGEAWSISTFLVDLESGETRLLIERGGSPHWSPSGHIVFTQGDGLYAVRFDAQALKTVGGPQSIGAGVRTENSWIDGYFSLSRGGTLVHSPGSVTGASRSVVVVDHDGKISPFVEERGPFEDLFAVSPDGTRVAVTVGNKSGLYETWVSDPGRPRLRRLIASTRADCGWPAWSADGRALYCSIIGPNLESSGVHVSDVDGSTPMRRVLERQSTDIYPAVADARPGGGSILVLQRTWRQTDLLWVPIGADGSAGEPRVIVEGSPHVDWARYSPDGSLLAFAVSERAGADVFVAAIAEDGSLGARVSASGEQASIVGWIAGAEPASQALLLLRPNKRIYRVLVTKGSRLMVSEPVLATDLSGPGPELGRVRCLPDGRLIGVQQPKEDEAPDRLTVVLNFDQVLREKLPAEE